MGHANEFDGILKNRFALNKKMTIKRDKKSK